MSKVNITLDIALEALQRLQVYFTYERDSINEKVMADLDSVFNELQHIGYPLQQAAKDKEKKVEGVSNVTDTR